MDRFKTNQIPLTYAQKILTSNKQKNLKSPQNFPLALPKRLHNQLTIHKKATNIYYINMKVHGNNQIKIM